MMIPLGHLSRHIDKWAYGYHGSEHPSILIYLDSFSSVCQVPGSESGASSEVSISESHYPLTVTTLLLWVGSMLGSGCLFFSWWPCFFISSLFGLVSSLMQISGLEWREGDWFTNFLGPWTSAAELRRIPACDGLLWGVHYHKAKETCSVFCRGFVVWLCRIKSLHFRFIITTFQLGIVGKKSSVLLCKLVI